MDPFDDDIEKLLARERQRPDIAPEHVRALRDAAAQRIALDVAVGPEGAPAPASAAGISASKAAVWSVAIFVAGLGTGVALTRWLMTDTPSTPSRSADAGVPDEGVSSVRSGETAPQEAVGALQPSQGEVAQGTALEPNAPAPSTSRMPRDSPATGVTATGVAVEPQGAAPGEMGVVRDGALNTERLLVEAAQSALARGQAGAALEHAAEHAQQFPQGRLAAEREALAIRALLRLGRVDAARQRAEAFDARWPGSLLRGSFAASLARALEDSGPP
jgi:hypothetical protein